jgi:hypothetical protein
MLTEHESSMLRSKVALHRQGVDLWDSLKRESDGCNDISIDDDLSTLYSISVDYEGAPKHHQRRFIVMARRILDRRLGQPIADIILRKGLLVGGSFYKIEVQRRKPAEMPIHIQEKRARNLTSHKNAELTERRGLAVLSALRTQRSCGDQPNLEKAIRTVARELNKSTSTIGHAWDAFRALVKSRGYVDSRAFQFACEGMTVPADCFGWSDFPTGNPCKKGRPPAVFKHPV